MTMSCIYSDVHLSDLKLVPKLPSVRLERTHFSLSHSSYSRAACRHASVAYKKKAFLPLVYSATKYNSCAPVCAYRGTGHSDSEDEVFSLVSLKNAVDKFKQEQSLVGSLKKRIQELQSTRHGGGGRPPWGGNGGSGGSEGEGFSRMMDELLQVILATFGFIFLYIFIVRGEELTRLGFDYVRYLCGGQSSSRLRRAMDRWRLLYQRVTGRKLQTEDNDSFLVHQDDDISPDDWLL